MTHTSKDLARLGVDPIAIEFRRWRRKHKLSQPEAARLLDVHVVTLCHYELGVRRRTLVGIARRMQNLMIYWRESLRADCTRPKRKRGRKPGRRSTLRPLAKCKPRVQTCISQT